MAHDAVMRELQDTVAIVTGSARNIGRAIALELSSAGAAVVVHAKSSQQDAEAVAREIEAEGGRAIVHLADLSRPEAARGMVDAALATFGRVDTLVNCAAMRRDAPIEEITFESWNEVIGSILHATFLCSQACAPHLSIHGKGSIVNIGGVAAHTGIGGRAHVVAAKAGVTGLPSAIR